MVRKAEVMSLLRALEYVAPGAPLREGLNQIRDARIGGIIVIGDSGAVDYVCDGGFELHAEFSPQRLFELAKMDGAIVLSEDLSTVRRANVHLVPDPEIPSSETGIRHRTAERVARQTESLVISISSARDIVSLYVDGSKYVLVEIPVILAKANQALQTLEKYKARRDSMMADLSALEFEGLVTLGDAATGLQRAEMAERVADEIERYIVELGIEGRLIRMQLDDLMAHAEEEKAAVIRDYGRQLRRFDRISQDLSRLNSEELLDVGAVARVLGFDSGPESLDQGLKPRGFRLLGKVPRLPQAVVTNIVERFHNLQGVMDASIDELDMVDGVGEARARAIRSGLRRLKEYSGLERFLEEAERTR